MQAYNIDSSASLTVQHRLLQAQTLFSLSAVFGYFSSSRFFGEEQESPILLRIFAAALMIKAYEIDTSVFGTDKNLQKLNFFEYLTRMLCGNKMDPVIKQWKKVSFECTAIVSGMMIKHANSERNFAKVLNQIKPPGW